MKVIILAAVLAQLAANAVLAAPIDQVKLPSILGLEA